jgi:Cytochrome C oxidase, cbb3-type, subunit III
MERIDRTWRNLFAAGGLVTLFGGIVVLVTVAAHSSEASIFWHKRCHTAPEAYGEGDPACVGDHDLTGGLGGTWYWLRSPEEEKQVIASLYNRYCIRCHGVDGRGIWDIPGVPDFTNARWQATRSDAQLARAVLEGRGAVMPPFRGTLNLEEAWAMARYLRTFIPGTETPRPDVGQPSKPGTQSPAPAPRKVEGSPQ